MSAQVDDPVRVTVAGVEVVRERGEVLDVTSADPKSFVHQSSSAPALHTPAQ